MMSKMSRCWGSNDGFIREERTAFIIRRVFAKGADGQGGVTRGFDFAEGVTSEHLRSGLRKYVLHYRKRITYVHCDERLGFLWIPKN